MALTVSQALLDRLVLRVQHLLLLALRGPQARLDLLDQLALLVLLRLRVRLARPDLLAPRVQLETQEALVRPGRLVLQALRATPLR